MLKPLSILISCCAWVVPAMAQNQIAPVKQAILQVTTTIVAPDEDEQEPAMTQSTGANGEEMRMIRIGGDGETKSIITIKDHLTKTAMLSEMGNTTLIRDNMARKTTTLLEIMGNRTGFWATDEEQEANRKRLDSMIRETPRPGMATAAPVVTRHQINYLNDEKKIAGVTCRKAIITLHYANQTQSDVPVWYYPGLRFEYLPVAGGVMGGPGMMAGSRNSNGLQTAWKELDGFPMWYEVAMPRGRSMRVVVTKIDLNKTIADKEFAIPSDYDVKPMKDLENGGMGNIRIRVGG